ncbi:D-2-hydroxyacid dehydrogenase [Kushneria marisflavi]|uniref:Glycerate dehydrogenase n=1 Tax=Kushneria marisflavi TaxID=157779 RepID=A0A240UJK6_9GAMM|nr:D-2-hydroxyacid dehydrogenase [Kushneria marisflavi]ART61658.1 glycerate dehydrogenase [Kushneria marisflavi]RKD86671.1 glycerate dehydrogenase [Kushneria marisflavi]
MKAVILDSDTLGSDIDLSPLSGLTDQFDRWGATRPEDVAKRLDGATIAITNKVVIDGDTLALLPDLEMIAVTATGTNNIDLQAAQARGITVANVTGYGTQSVAQHTLMIMLALATRLPRYQHDVATHRWEQAASFCLQDHPTMQLAGKHLVLVGSGELGQAVAQLARAFGMNVSFCARPNAERDDRPALETLLPEADVVSLHCPLTPETHHLINQARLQLMKSHALLVNCGRGGLIDEQASLEALKHQRLGGLGVDVLPTEPPREGHELIEALAQNSLNLIVTPHNAWITPEARQNIVSMTADNIRGFLSKI